MFTKLLIKVRNFLLEHINSSLFAPSMKQNFDHFQVELEFLEEYANNDAFWQQANKIMDHCFNLLGSGDVHLGKSIDWSCDFKSSYRWEPLYYSKIQKQKMTNVLLESSADIKVPWELSRFQHLPVLGQAYRSSGDEKYTREFMAQINSWLEANPLEMGPNWVSSMDISLRVVSLIIAYYLFRGSTIIKHSFWEKFYSLLYYSGVHIEHNLEVDKFGHGNNHHLANCAAMVWLGLFFGSYNKRSIKWLQKGLPEFCAQMAWQVNQDGGCFEGSISYHRLAVEIFLLTTILAEKNNQIFSINYKESLEKMCEFTMHYTKGNGLAPQFGDADDGRFCILSGYGTDDIRDHRSVLAIAGEYFQRDDFRDAAGKMRIICELEMVSFPDTGFYIFRDQTIFLMLKCGKVGQYGTGGHDHNDQLSFELCVDGVDLVVDPGSYVYTMDKDLRQEFRSTKYHNISQLDNLELNIIKNDNHQDLFCMYTSNPGVCHVFDKTPAESGHFSGEITLGGTDIKYHRDLKIDYKTKIIDIVDTFTSSGKMAVCRLHLDTGVQIQHVNENTVIISSGDTSAKIETDSVIQVQPGFVSPSYGLKNDSLVLCWNFSGETKFRIYY